MSTNKEIDNLTIDAKILATTIEVETTKFSESFNQHKKALEAELVNLKELNVMLQSVPKKINTQFKESIPDIVAKLDALNTQKIEAIKNTHQRDFKEQSDSLEKTEEKVRLLTEGLDKFSKKRIIRFFLGIIISSAISVGCAIYAASYMMQTFPTRVTIHKPENIILYDSEVDLWGVDNNVIKGLRKNDKKNNRKF